MADDREEMGEFVRQGTGIREVFQAVEDALVENGYDEFVVATDLGSFQWTRTQSKPSNGEL